MLAKFSWLNPKGPYLSLEKEKETFSVVLTYSIKRAPEIRKFHVAVVQQRLRNVQKSVMHVQSCFLALTMIFFGDVAGMALKANFFKFQSMSILAIRCNRPETGNSFKT